MGDMRRTVRGRLNFLAATDDKPQTHIGAPDKGRLPTRPQTARHEVDICDIRSDIGGLSLDVQGLAVINHQTSTKDFYDEGKVAQVYYPEVEALVKTVTGASCAHVFDHNVRNETRANAGADNAHKPVKYVHNDYTVKSGPQRLQELLAAEEAGIALKGRFAFINVWRPIVGPVLDTPLAVCDARSMSEDDFVATDLVYGNRTGEVYSVRHNPRQRWYYVSKMQVDEVLFLKCYDSQTDGRARFTAHSAFRDPDCPPGSAPRESIEVRTIAIFDSTV